MANYTFRTPHVDEGYATRGLWRYLKQSVGVSVYKQNGVYKTGRYLVDGDTQLMQEFYSGGHLHTVNDATKSALIAANIGITEANFTAQ